MGYMKNKKLVIILGIVIIILIISGFFYLLKNNTKSNFKSDSRYNASDFLYSNPSDVIPEDKRISYDDLATFRTRIINNNSISEICVSNGEEMVLINLFTKKIKNCPHNVDGCQSYSSRYAMVCGNQYIIAVPSLASGGYFYGIFELK